MHFIYPGFLFALFALAIPIIIHLFNFRRFKKVYFTNVRFLKEIRQDTQSRSRLKHLLILASRLLAIAFLVLAFAQPYIPVTNKIIEGGVTKVSIYIDNSFSMDALGKNGNLLESAKKKAREIGLAYKPSDQFQLLTSDFEARHQRLVSRDEFLQLVDEVKPGPAVRLLSDVLQRQEEALSTSSEKSPKQSFIISDFQKSITDQGIPSDSTIQINLVPVEASVQNNIYIDTCFLAAPFVQLNAPTELTVVVRNAGNANADNVSIKLTINGVQKALASVSVPEETSGQAKLTFTLSEPGWQQASLSISDYPVSFDDNFYFSFNVRSNLNILCLNGKNANPAIDAVFGNDDYYRLQNTPAGQIDYAAFPSSQLIILNEIPEFSSGMIQELQKYVQKGGSVFVIPSDEANIQSYNELAGAMGTDRFAQFVTANDKVVSLDENSELFTGVFEKGKKLPDNLDLPVVNRYYTFARSTASRSRTIMRMQSGSAFLLASVFAKGKVYMLATSLNADAGSFSRHALFVPVFLRAALQGSSEVPLPLVIGHDKDFTVSDTLVSNDNIFHLINKSLNFDIIPESKLLNSNTVITVHDQVSKAQNYELTASGKLIACIAFNYDRKESDLKVLTTSELEKITELPGVINLSILDAEGKNLSHTITQRNEGKRLWKYFIIGSLLFLAAEIALIRFFQRLTPVTK